MSPAEKLRKLPADKKKQFIESLTESEAAVLMRQWRGFLARPKQLAPESDWFIWLLLAGRGFGKTRSGAEFVKEEVESGRARDIALVGANETDAKDVMVLGRSGILSLYDQNERPDYNMVKGLITWPCGAQARVFKATAPENLRGFEFDLAWSDEICKWKYQKDTWDNLQFCLRAGKRARQIVTTTPKNHPLIRAIASGAAGKVEVTRGSSYENIANMSKNYVESVLSQYDGTRLGRQEIEAEILSDAENALWRSKIIDDFRVSVEPKDLKRIVVAVDPAVSSTEKSDENGIIVCGITAENEAYVLADYSLQGGPFDWSKRAINAYDEYQADAIVAEVNQGGDMVEHTIKSVRSNANVISVRASRGKHVRCEPIAALYEQGRVHHVGVFSELEQQMMDMTSTGFIGEGSPDRLDALVWGLSDLYKDVVRGRNTSSAAVLDMLSSRRVSSGGYVGF